MAVNCVSGTTCFLELVPKYLYTTTTLFLPRYKRPTPLRVVFSWPPTNAATRGLQLPHLKHIRGQKAWYKRGSARAKPSSKETQETRLGLKVLKFTAKLALQRHSCFSKIKEISKKSNTLSTYSLPDELNPLLCLIIPGD